jgi:serine/threonine protein kinase/tetratricopeptide (TPR) repeat protein
MAPLPQKIGKYQIASLLGKGGMGEVYKAQDPTLGRFVALKIMRGPALDDTQARERFIREAQAAGGLRHPNVVTVYDIGEVEGQMYIAMEFIPGDDLEKVIRGRMPLSIDDKLNIMIQAGEGVAYAHKHQIVHRDLKPANIRIDEEGIVKIMDFGIAKVETSNMTASGTVMGTPYYMSPEQVRGMRVDPRSDLFALGAILYEIFTYRKAFDGEMAAVFYKIVHEQPEPIQQFMDVPSAPLQEIINRCLDKDRNARLQTAGELVDMLKRTQQQYKEMNAATVCGISASELGPANPEFRLAPAPTAVGTGATRRRDASTSENAATVLAAGKTELAAPHPGSEPTVLSPAPPPPATQFDKPATLYSPTPAPPPPPAPTPAPAPAQPVYAAPVPERKGSMLPLIIVLVLFLGAAGLGGVYFFFLRGSGSTGDNPADYAPQVAEAKQLYQSGKYQEAADVYEKLLQKHSSDANLHFLMGAAKRKLFKNDEAFREYQKAVELDPKLDKAWQQLGFLYVERMDYQNAENALQRATQLAPGDPAGWEGLGQTYTIVKEPDKAEAAYRRLLELEPSNLAGLYNLGAIYLAKGRMEDAQKLFEKTIELNPNYAEAYNNLGLIYGQQGRIDEAIAMNEKAIRIKQNLPPAYYQLSEYYARKNDRAKAAEYLKTYIEMTGDRSPELAQKLREYGG